MPGGVLTDAMVISTHTLRKEGDIEAVEDVSHDAQFQPTPSARRVTPTFPSHLPKIPDFNPHPPQGG